MKFQIPQFIETETKLIGPFTLKQFLWLASGGALIFFMFLTMNSLLFFLVAFPVGAFFAALAFVKTNPKQYIFKREESEQDLREIIISDESK
ncbi:MAG: PrgI family protein [Candidatus Yanofskybacteria bacterium]|nr:PrgI family protein [Candidatus Yanofskybacteria bacterium]